ncbi:MAG TPA: phosphotransferase, partial [Actinomycetota bacterium]|nr:phosphotransferase [Actinomycetota bacterium]
LRYGRRGRQWETAFGKVLPGDKARRIESASPRLNVAGRRVPLAMPAGQVGEDGFVFPAMGGRSLRDLLVRGGSLPSARRVADLPLTLAAEVEEARVDGLADRMATVDLARSAAGLVRHLVPWFAGDADRIVEAASAGADRDPRRPGIVHGDLYEAQIFVGEGYRLGLIDLDDLGRGDAALDAANFCAHLLALAMAVPSAADRLVAYRRLVRPAFARALDVPVSSLAWREAVCMLLLAAGPFRVLDPSWPAEVGRRVALAVRLLEDP